MGPSLDHDAILGRPRCCKRASRPSRRSVLAAVSATSPEAMGRGHSNWPEEDTQPAAEDTQPAVQEKQSAEPEIGPAPRRELSEEALAFTQDLHPACAPMAHEHVSVALQWQPSHHRQPAILPTDPEPPAPPPPPPPPPSAPLTSEDVDMRKEPHMPPELVQLTHLASAYDKLAMANADRLAHGTTVEIVEEDAAMAFGPDASTVYPTSSDCDSNETDVSKEALNARIASCCPQLIRRFACLRWLFESGTRKPLLASVERRTSSSHDSHEACEMSAAEDFRSR